MIQFEHIQKTYKTAPVLQDVSFTIRDGELMAVVGSSGCGKTTLLKMINRLVEPTGGRISIDGEDIQKIDATHLRRQMGYVIQQTGLFVHMTVGDNIGIIPSLQGRPRQEIDRHVEDLLEMVGLEPEEFKNRYPSQLSGGQRQRVGVARAFATDPKIILMDEPFSALDPITRIQLQDELMALQARLKKTIVFVTHDIDEAIRIADRICILHKGYVEQLDTPENILLHPATAHAKRFIGDARIWNFPQYLTAGHVLAEDAVTCSPEAPLAGYRQLQAHALYVTAADGTFCGVVSREKLLSAPQLTARQAMEAACTVDRWDRLSAALDKMDAAGAVRAPVLENGRFCGYISQKSIAAHLFAHQGAAERKPL